MSQAIKRKTFFSLSHSFFLLNRATLLAWFFIFTTAIPTAICHGEVTYMHKGDNHTACLFLSEQGYNHSLFQVSMPGKSKNLNVCNDGSCQWRNKKPFKGFDPTKSRLIAGEVENPFTSFANTQITPAHTPKNFLNSHDSQHSHLCSFERLMFPFSVPLPPQSTAKSFPHESQ